jgi:hypothetical protein
MPAARQGPDEDALRVAYRRALALCYLSDHPGASRRDIARAARLDERYVLSLLANLQETGLAAPLSLSDGAGGADGWQLTPRGIRMVGSRPRTPASQRAPDESHSAGDGAQL